MENKRALGSKYEDLAVAYLEELGFEILERNYRTRFGEIDIIAREYVEERVFHKTIGSDYLCFIEVKYRSSNGSGTPFDAINYHKMRQISRCALHFLRENRISDNQSMRFDVIGIQGDRGIELIRNAFPFSG